MIPRSSLSAFLFAVIFIIGLSVGAFLALGENVTVSGVKNVTVLCDNQSSCVVTAEGQGPVFFNASGGNLTYGVSQSFTVERNITIVQNITINITNVTQNVTVVTQEVAVMNCTTASLNFSPQDVATLVTVNITAGIGESCRDSCALSDDDRRTLQDARREAQIEMERVKINAEAAVNVTTIRYDALNQSCMVEVASLQHQVQTSYWFVYMVLAIIPVAAFIILRKVQASRGSTGMKSAPKGERR